MRYEIASLDELADLFHQRRINALRNGAASIRAGDRNRYKAEAVIWGEAEAIVRETVITKDDGPKP